MSALKNTLIFTAGAAVGTVVTGLVVKEYYEKEIDSLRDTFTSSRKKKKNSKSKVETEENETEDKISEEEREEKIKEAASIARKHSYKTDYASIHKSSKSAAEKEESKPVASVKECSMDPEIIDPNDLGGNDLDYDIIELYYYEGDKTLVDSGNVPVDDITDKLGTEWKDHFGEYEDDSVCVRNHDRRVDYQVLLDERSYADVMRVKRCKEK